MPLCYRHENGARFLWHNTIRYYAAQKQGVEQERQAHA